MSLQSESVAVGPKVKIYRRSIRRSILLLGRSEIYMTILDLAWALAQESGPVCLYLDLDLHGLLHFLFYTQV